MDIPTRADVHCTDGLQGRSTCVIVNPVTERVTHVVVKQERRLYAERLVPVRLIKETRPKLIWLDCAREEVDRLRPLVETEFIRIEIPMLDYESDEMVGLPYAVLDVKRLSAKQKHESIPRGELAVRRGTRVEAVDGPIGRVDEFVIDPADGRITYLILQKGHPWGQKEVVILVSEIERIKENVVRLKLSKRQIEALPAVPVRRRWLERARSVVSSAR